MNNTAIFSVDEDRSLDLISMGRVAVDLYAEQISAELKDAQTFRKYLGGCAGNIAVGSARLGLRVSMLSCVGSDAMGQFLLDSLREENVDVSGLQISNQHLTGLVMLGVCPPDHFPLIFFRNDCADMAIDAEKISVDYLKKSKALLITGTGLSNPRTRATTLKAVALAKSVNTKIILDVDYRPVLWGLAAPGDGENRYVANSEVSQIFSQLLPLVDLIVGTDEEIKIAGACEEIEDAIVAVRKKTSAPIVVKKGKQGAQIYFDDLGNPLSCAGFPITVQNVLGAGDAFMAGLLSALLKGESFYAALRRANACGALVVSRHGCAPAMPSQDEVDYFIKISDDNLPIAETKLNFLHQRTVIKEKARMAPMPIFAFCHRWQFEESCDQFQKSHHHISLFKEALARGLVRSRRENDIINPFMLCDPTYGAPAIAHGEQDTIGMIVAIEKSKSRLAEWYVEKSAYEILVKRPPTWGVKILWHFQSDFPESDKQHQLTHLRELHDACMTLDRKLMLEVIVNKDNDDELIETIAQVYQEGITPYWWKLPKVNSHKSILKLASVIDEFDNCARIVVLGGDAKELSDYHNDFKIAKSTHHSIGFAVGRSIFWPVWMSYMNEQSTLLDVEREVAERFYELYRIWMDA